MIEIDCPQCGSKERTVQYPAKLLNVINEFDYLTESGSHYQIVDCKDCNLRYSSPIYSEEEILGKYQMAEIHNSLTPLDMKAIKMNMARYLDRLTSTSKITSGRLLDIGSGMGELVEIALERGFDCIGVEPSKLASEYAKQKVGNERIISDAYTRDIFQEQSFSLVTVIHVIDHVVSPKELLRDVYNHLRPGGFVFVAAHNISSLMAKLLGEEFIAYSVQHICYFDRTTLSKLLTDLGYKVVSIRGSLTSYPLSHYVENGISNKKLRSTGKRVLKLTGLADQFLTFPFGNIEIIAQRI